VEGNSEGKVIKGYIIKNKIRIKGEKSEKGSGQRNQGFKKEEEVLGQKPEKRGNGNTTPGGSNAIAVPTAKEQRTARKRPRTGKVSGGQVGKREISV